MENASCVADICVCPSLRCHLKLKLKVKIRSSDVQDAAATAIFLVRTWILRKNVQH